ncbi:unnamed protein product [Urochloa humidicola]
MVAGAAGARQAAHRRRVALTARNGSERGCAAVLRAAAARGGVRRQDTKHQPDGRRRLPAITGVMRDCTIRRRS